MKQYTRVSWDNFDWDKIKAPSNSFRRDHKYSPFIAGFDLESTNYHNIFAFMYIWTFTIEDQTAYGRTWADLREFLADAKEHLRLSYGHKLIVLDQNLKYDFGFFKREIPIDGKLIAKSSHEIIICTVFDCMEFRDTLNYTECSLDEMGKQIGYPKVHGYDYSKIRISSTELSAADLDYCCTDSEILVEYFGREAERFGGIHKVPLTATQRVKRLLSIKMRQYDSKSHLMEAMVRKRQLDPDDPKDRHTLKLLRIAFFGGYNYCTTMYKNQIIPNVDDWDADSHYIAQILLHKFPRDKFEPIRAPRSKAELQDMINHRGMYRNKAMLITFSFAPGDDQSEGLSARFPEIAFLPIYNKNYHKAELADRRSMVTRKMQAMSAGTMTLTDIDFALMFKWYKIGRIKIESVLATNYGSLPEYITKTCVDLYKQKKSAKAELSRIREEREPTAAEEEAYALIKSYLNRIYGIFVQDPVRTNYIFDGGSVVVDKNQRINTKNTQFAPVLYQWGVWVAAWARYELLSLLGALAVDRLPDGSTRYNYRVLYSDTDSIKGFDLDKQIIAQYNAKVKNRVAEFCRRSETEFADLDGIGEFVCEHYDYFKAIGQKAYAFCTPKGDFVYRVSGLARPRWDDELQREVCYFDKFDTIYEKFEAFDQDMKIPAEESGLMESIYGGERDPEIVSDDQGHTEEIKVRSYVMLQPRGYKNSEDILSLLDELDPERFSLMMNKFGIIGGGKDD